MTTIAHIADVHLRDRQYSCRARGRDFANALINAVNTAIAHGADAIICAGDLLDTARPSAATISDELTKVDKILTEAGIPMLVISGNHDLAEVPWMRVFDPHNDKRVGIVCADHREFHIGYTTILGLPFMPTEDMKRTLDDLRAGGKYYDIITWHGAISEFVGYPSPNTLDMEYFKDTCRLVAMGDQHIHRMKEEHQVVVAYPGSTEMCDECEDSEKKMYLWHFNADGDIMFHESIPFETRPVQRFVLKTELDVEEAITKLLPNSLVYVKYDRTLTNVIPRLNTVLTPDNIFRPVALPDTTTKSMKKLKETRELLTSPRDFVSAALRKVIPESQLERIEDLCLDMVDSNADYRYSIDKFCSDQMEGKIIL